MCTKRATIADPAPHPHIVGVGTPELTLMGLRRLRDEGMTQIDEQAAQRVARQSLQAAWTATRHYIEDREPAADPLLDALATFYSAEVRARTPIVLQYAAHLWRSGDYGERPWRRIPALRHALTYLAHFDIVERDSIIVHRDVIAAGEIAPDIARQQLRAFLTNHRRLFQRQWLRRLYADAESHAWTLFDLAVESQQTDDHRTSIEIYNCAIALLPHFGLYNNRGNAYDELGEYERAIQDYDQAIQLDPEYATAYYNLADVYVDLGQLDKAIPLYQKRIELEPATALSAHVALGVIAQHQGDDHTAQTHYTAALHAYDPAHQQGGQSRS